MSLRSDQEISDFIDRLEKEAKALKSEALRLCWYMRGSISYNEAMMLSYEDRDIISTMIKDNLETTKKSGLPFF